jgi:hypothetical protein
VAPAVLPLRQGRAKRTETANFFKVFCERWKNT